MNDYIKKAQEKSEKALLQLMLRGVKIHIFELLSESIMDAVDHLVDVESKAVSPAFDAGELNTIVLVTEDDIPKDLIDNITDAILEEVPDYFPRFADVNIVVRDRSIMFTYQIVEDRLPDLKKFIEEELS